MNKLMTLTLAAAGAVTVGGCVADTYDAGPWGYYDRGYYTRYGAYDWNHPDPRYNGYYPEHYYVSNPRYREYTLTPNDRIYRGQDGNYYCRRSDGTTGKIVGGIAGGVLGGIIGNAIAPGGSGTLGTILGGAAGAAAGASVGASVDRDNSRVVCD